MMELKPTLKQILDLNQQLFTNLLAVFIIAVVVEGLLRWSVTRYINLDLFMLILMASGFLVILSKLI